MDIDDFVNRIERLTQGVQTGSASPWAFAAERTLVWLQSRMPGTDLATKLQYLDEGTNRFTILAPSYLLYQNYGVAGAEQNRGAQTDEFKGIVHKFGTRRPPASVFERYTDNPGKQFAIATSVYKYGIRPKNWFNQNQLAEMYTMYAQQFINDNIQ